MIESLQHRPPAVLSERAGGLLLHPTSLPGPLPSGDLGPAAFRFVDQLARAGQRWWQMLPVHPVGKGFSPYSALSAFAGEPRLISPERLVEEGCLDELPESPAAKRRRVSYRRAFAYRDRLLARGGGALRRRWGGSPEFARFREENAAWLGDATLFVTLAEELGTDWTTWPGPLMRREVGALAAAREHHAEALQHRELLQFVFERQWQELRQHAHARGVRLMGDIPIFVPHGSADVWAHPEQFQIGEDGRPRRVAGVPPDAFNEAGQLWETVLYDWPRMRADGYAWWIARLTMALRRFDAVRLDHFIGFHRYWSVPAGAETAIEGEWQPGPGADFFEVVQRRLPGAALIAEDLGQVTPEVVQLREQFGLPGMKVLQFAFGDDDGDGAHRPHRIGRNTVVYTGTHDNNTTRGWYRAIRREAREGDAEARRTLARIHAAFGDPGRKVHWHMMRAASLSRAAIAIFPVQDLLGLGRAARMNLPGTPQGNWRYRLEEGALTDDLLEELRALSEFSGRLNP